MNSINEKFTKLFQINLESKIELHCIYIHTMRDSSDNTKKLCGFISIVVPQKKFLVLVFWGERQSRCESTEAQKKIQRSHASIMTIVTVIIISLMTNIKTAIIIIAITKTIIIIITVIIITIIMIIMKVLIIVIIFKIITGTSIVIIIIIIIIIIMIM